MFRVNTLKKSTAINGGEELKKEKLRENNSKNRTTIKSQNKIKKDLLLVGKQVAKQVGKQVD
jgi:hypothetical protein